MNKRLFFILLPFLALLSFFNNSEGVSHVEKSSALQQERYLIKSAQTNNNSPSVLSKDSQDKNRNKIRIKAWDDYAAINFNEYFPVARPVLFYITSGYSNYDFYFQSPCLSSSSLRGPPAA